MYRNPRKFPPVNYDELDLGTPESRLWELKWLLFLDACADEAGWRKDFIEQLDRILENEEGISARAMAYEAAKVLFEFPRLVERFVKDFLREGYSVTLVPPSGIIVRTQHGHEFTLDRYEAPDPSFYIRHTR
ncbi:hypothetical protein PsYK624_124770 [Phanerochaete sordida]|uniref:Uncharacterized protein n=1 Tax=Phanerochaete sordida TaxID=48140 RepID=A0A9P3LIL2_9APHY|nr:hypothetical protein PsYK624_124770 [Phanerochaete sordida]